MQHARGSRTTARVLMEPKVQQPATPPAEAPAGDAPAAAVPAGGDPWEDTRWTKYKVSTIMLHAH